jgi:hypothetical protein
MMIAQLGGVSAVPTRSGNLFGGKADLLFYEGTGAIKKLDAAGEDMPADMLEGVAASVTGVIPSDDEVKELERRKTILELEAAIRKLEQDAAASSD